MKTGQKKDCVLGLRIKHEDKVFLFEEAKKRGLTLTNFLLRSAKQILREEQPLKEII